uniref:STAT transcription factor protein interaction domain-containing protein n=1 Tax=Neolamprologus brichardi TaxID=32507 RepID=A0A3Q4FYX7_NEOBR
MAQWMHMTQMLQHLPYETVSSLYPPNSFPIEVRHYISEWIENQRWYDAHTYCTCTCLFFNLLQHLLLLKNAKTLVAFMTTLETSLNLLQHTC